MRVQKQTAGFEEGEFVYSRRVTWGDCDPALIAFTGKIPEFALEAIDAFWEFHLDGVGWYQFVADRDTGMPFVRMEIDFLSPITPRHILLCRVTARRLGSSSISFQVTGSQDGKKSFEGNFVNVFVDLGSFRKIDIPKDVREILEARYPHLEA
jgi:4-hydroxybenzoyl-CoA thioesterase